MVLPMTPSARPFSVHFSAVPLAESITASRFPRPSYQICLLAISPNCPGERKQPLVSRRIGLHLWIR